MSVYATAEDYRKFGFCIIRNVLDASEVEEFRALLDRTFLNRDPIPRMLLPQDILKMKELYLIPFRERVVEKLRASFGEELCYFTDFQLQRNMFGGHWHVDSGSEYHNAYLMDPSYRFAKCGVFLQDSTTGWGGTIDVVPKGHKFWLSRFTNQYLPNLFIKTMLDKFGPKFKGMTVHVKPGDMVFFDSRLPHISTNPTKENMKAVEIFSGMRCEGIPPEHTKYVFYWNAMNKSMASDFLINSQKRVFAEESYGKELFYSDYLSHSYPDDYPDDFVRHAEKQRVHIASLEKFKTDVFKMIHKEYSLPEPIEKCSDDQ